jgi:hypothetical protein
MSDGRIGQYRTAPVPLTNGQLAYLGVDVDGNLLLSAVIAGGVDIIPPSAIRDEPDLVLAANTVTPLVGAPVTCYTAILVAPVGNADLIRFGGATIGAARGAILNPGQSVSVSIDDLSKIFIWSATAGVKVAVTFAGIPGGPNHVASESIDGVSKQLTIVIANSLYQHL